MVNVTQQAGGALGLAILVTVFGSAHGHLVHGMASAFTVATLFDVCALLVMAGAAVLPLATARARRARRAVGAGC